MSVTTILAALAVSTTPNYQQILDQFQVSQEVPGVSAVITYQDKVLYAGASGLADVESRRPMTADTVMYAGSLTKILTAVLTLQLVDDGKLSLDDHVPGISGEDTRISVFHLLTHSSGLDREGNFGYWYNAEFPDDAALSLYLFNAELRASPGKSSHYSNIGYAALGAFIGRVSGQSYGEAFRKRVLQPLGMISSGAPGPGPGVARGYTPVGRMIPNEQRPFAGVGQGVGTRHLREYHDAKAMTPAFGAYTSVSDLGKLVRFLLGFGPENVLSDNLRSQMLTSQKSGRGLGLRMGCLNNHPVARHDGWFAAHRSHLLLDLEAGVGVVVLGNSDSASPGIIAEALIAAALESDPNLD
jgi:CubicO group peptidase (beta-lactamase class C family)